MKEQVWKRWAPHVELFTEDNKIFWWAWNSHNWHFRWAPESKDLFIWTGQGWTYMERYSALSQACAASEGWGKAMELFHQWIRTPPQPGSTWALPTPVDVADSLRIAEEQKAEPW
jgi:hypothetical protein